jgi:hypothetical protein
LDSHGQALGTLLFRSFLRWKCSNGIFPDLRVSSSCLSTFDKQQQQLYTNYDDQWSHMRINNSIPHDVKRCDALVEFNSPLQGKNSRQWAINLIELLHFYYSQLWKFLLKLSILSRWVNDFNQKYINIEHHWKVIQVNGDKWSSCWCVMKHV